jgi:hypothetical protein
VVASAAALLLAHPTLGVTAADVERALGEADRG